MFVDLIVDELIMIGIIESLLLDTLINSEFPFRMNINSHMEIVPQLLIKTLTSILLDKIANYRRKKMAKNYN